MEQKVLAEKILFRVGKKIDIMQYNLMILDYFERAIYE